MQHCFRSGLQFSVRLGLDVHSLDLCLHKPFLIGRQYGPQLSSDGARVTTCSSDRTGRSLSGPPLRATPSQVPTVQSFDIQTSTVRVIVLAEPRSLGLGDPTGSRHWKVERRARKFLRHRSRQTCHGCTSYGLRKTALAQMQNHIAEVLQNANMIDQPHESLSTCHLTVVLFKSKLLLQGSML